MRQPQLPRAYSFSLANQTPIFSRVTKWPAFSAQVLGFLCSLGGRWQSDHMTKPRTCKCMWQVLPSRKACCTGSPGHVPFAFVLLTLYSRICLVERFVSCNHEDKNHQLRIAECFIPDSLHRTKIKLYLVKCLIRFQLHAAKCNPDWYKKKFWVKWYMLLKVFIVCPKCPPKCCYAPWHSI